jgi:hypothetical protein
LLSLAPDGAVEGQTSMGRVEGCELVTTDGCAVSNGSVLNSLRELADAAGGCELAHAGGVRARLCARSSVDSASLCPSQVRVVVSLRCRVLHGRHELRALRSHSLQNRVGLSAHVVGCG